MAMANMRAVKMRGWMPGVRGEALEEITANIHVKDPGGASGGLPGDECGMDDPHPGLISAPFVRRGDLLNRNEGTHAVAPQRA
ncbi:hypothetical protein E2C01_071817 [Portunus trituberculatus]|uniref:Uncharacterized protein n=1 Tax=Portunus trituberculatus TaxID=210409 RepID=A0A5B7I5F7_PORTR|nr:hypothetical protein [Portunus trituberculatus]